jgi:hypothetical protein
LKGGSAPPKDDDDNDNDSDRNEEEVEGEGEIEAKPGRCLERTRGGSDPETRKMPHWRRHRDDGHGGKGERGGSLFFL